MRKSLVVLILFLLAAGSPLWAENVANPNSRLYTDLSLWQERGLIRKLPPYRPYPIQLVKRYLKRVEHDGTASDRNRAAAYLKQIGGKFNAQAKARAELRSNLKETFKEVGAQAQLAGSLSPKLSYSASLGAKAISSNGGAVLPEYRRTTENYLYDSSVTPLFSTGLTPRLSMTSQAAFGSASTYIQAGIMRSSFGPFFGDNAILSPFAPQAGVVSFTWQEGFFTYSQLFEDLTATNNDGTPSGTSYSKYLALHSLEFYPLPWLDLGIYDTVVWGHRLEPLYFLPIPTILFYAQGLHNYPDNSLLGLSGTVKLPHRLRAKGILYVDDAGFNQLVKLDFSQAMFVAAAQGGLSWTPDLPFLTRLSANYLLVTPYTYSHQGASSSAVATNYQNYTTQGENLGPSLQPNSDRIELKALLRPTPFLGLTLFGRYIRHGNASEGQANMPAGSNGTIFDPGYTSSGVGTFVHSTRFLSQAVLEKTLQTGFVARLHFATPVGEITGNLGYTFEYVRNAINGWGNGYPVGSASNGNPVAGNNITNNYVSVSVDIRYP